MNRRVLFVVTNHTELGDTGQETGFDLTEVTKPYRVLRDAGFEVDFASPSGGDAPVDPKSRDRDDADGAAFLDDPAAREKIRHTRRAGELRASDYDAIFFAGGHGTMWDFPDASDLQRLAADIHDSGGVVAAICHGPAALLHVRLASGHRLIEGRRVSCFTNEEEREVGRETIVPFLLASRLEELGATHTKAPPFEEHVEVHGRLVTGQNPASAEALAEEMLSLIEESASHDDAAE